jgi:tripartite-type tricarboxylate transporter receptor subunit TctC
LRCSTKQTSDSTTRQRQPETPRLSFHPHGFEKAKSPATAASLLSVNAYTSAWSQAADPSSGKPLRVILPVGPNSGVDTIMRAAAPALSKSLGQQVVIENLTGAGGLIGTTAITKAAPDGMTVGVVSNNHVVNPSVYKRMPFDALNDITPISVVGETPFVLVVNPGVLAKNARELADYLKAKPGAYNYGSSGSGTIIHLAGAMFVDAAKVEVMHLPYKNVGAQLTDIAGGQVEFGAVAVPAAIGQIKGNLLRPIGVMGQERVAALPDVPTLAEQGYPQVDIAGWFAVVGPAKLPDAEVKRIHSAVVEAFATLDLQATMEKQNNVIHPNSPEEAVKFFKSELDRYAGLVKRADIKVD